MPKLKKIHTLVFALGVAILMQLLCGCGSDSDDGCKEALKNTLDNHLHLNNPDKDVPILKLQDGRELTAHVDNEEIIAFIAKGEKTDSLNHYGGFWRDVNLDEEQYQFDKEKIVNLCNKILKVNEAIKYDIEELVDNRESVDGYGYNEYIVKIQYPDFAKIHAEAGKVLENEANKYSKKEKSEGIQAYDDISWLVKNHPYEYNKCLYDFYDKTFSDLENLPMKSKELKYRVRHIVDKDKVNKKDKDKINDYVLVLNDTSDKLPNLIYIMFGEPGEKFAQYYFTDLGSKKYISRFLTDYCKNLPSEKAYKMLSDDYQKNTPYSEFVKIHKDLKGNAIFGELQIVSHENNIYKCKVKYSASKYIENNQWVDKRRLFNGIGHECTINIADLGDGVLRLAQPLLFSKEYETSKGTFQRE